MHRVRVKYTDGVIKEALVDEWADLRSDGVDDVHFVLSYGGEIQVTGQSIYWLYQDKNLDAWVVGGGTVNEKAFGIRHIVETVLYDSGRQEVRYPEFFPDLLHEEIKLGWWWNNKWLQRTSSETLRRTYPAT